MVALHRPQVAVLLSTSTNQEILSHSPQLEYFFRHSYVLPPISSYDSRYFTITFLRLLQYSIDKHLNYEITD